VTKRSSRLSPVAGIGSRLRRSSVSVLILGGGVGVRGPAEEFDAIVHSTGGLVIRQ
jgi:hypothetical protein